MQYISLDVDAYIKTMAKQFFSKTTDPFWDQTLAEIVMP
tara:strand:- start:1 stop:117 length:117 start_codon:yes stop_codon:yes gene_type:complete